MSGQEWDTGESDEEDGNVSNDDAGTGYIDGTMTGFWGMDSAGFRKADLAASGRQGARHRPTQLIPDGLTPKEHLSSAMDLAHPFLKNSVSTFAVNLALSRNTFSDALAMFQLWFLPS